MKSFQFRALLTWDSWLENAYVQVDSCGRIHSVSTQKPENQEIEYVDAYALPGFQNAHSHAFQYAMAGLAERHQGAEKADNFWSWREAMYQLALQVSPDQMEAIASMLYAEMLRQGYTEVAEFHYVHHDSDGKTYGNLAEMGERLIAAAQKVGIKITLIPIFYQKGGFGQEANERQRRFLSQDINAYLKLFEASRDATQNYEYARIAYGAHSLRAVGDREIKMLSQMVQGDTPVHLHIAEQKQEVIDSIRYLGMRPVDWLCSNIHLNSCFHLVHSTHMMPEETRALAQSGAHVVLCPSTEGNLGDGLFPLHTFQEAGGSWSIGTDSHIGLNPFEELRTLDYGQRIHRHSRDIFLGGQSGENARKAIQMAFKAGKKAMGEAVDEFFAVGEPLDALLMDARAPLLQCTGFDHLLDTILYTSDSSMHLGTLVNGEWKVKEERHISGDKIIADFVKAIGRLKNR